MREIHPMTSPPEGPSPFAHKPQTTRQEPEAPGDQPSSPPDRMMALRAHRRGGPDQLEYETAPTPQPRAGEVLIEVHAAGITFAELDWDLTWTTLDGQDRTP